MMRLLLFLLTTTVFSQNEFLTIENFLYVEDEIQVWSNDSIYRFNKNLQLVSIKQNPLVVSSDKISSISHVGNNSRNYYLSNGSGDVYDSTLKRISKTNNSSFYNNSSSFIHKDTIYKFGGYGFWTSFKQLVYFDFNNGDWNYFNLKNPKNFEGLFSSEIVKTEPGEYLVYGGDKLNLEIPELKKTHILFIKRLSFSLLQNFVICIFFRHLINFKKNKVIIQINNITIYQPTPYIPTIITKSNTSNINLIYV